MRVAFLKSASELMDQGHDFLIRGNFSSALAKYNDASRKFQKAGDANATLQAAAYGPVMDIAQRPSDPAAYRAAAQALRALGDAPVKPGLRESTGTQLAREADLLASEAEWTARRPASVPIGLGCSSIRARR